MDISVIIVNYNVKYFLEQCLCSVIKAAVRVNTEIIVVDNRSGDHSIEYLKPRFPSVRFIASEENLGFAKGCNLGLSQATGKYILFLNPDTIIPEDCLEKCISFFREHPDAGALGVRMVDGSGQFLKESKRSFPSPLTSLFKLFGLARLFPHSKTFARYHLGHLDEHEVNEVDVLAGAFMMIRKDVLDKVGSFDETFFMYGEDVDLSYRIQKAECPPGGPLCKNYYFPGTSIIHFKGESTRKGSMNYVRMFYTAMSTFVKKHYGGSRAGLFNFLIHLAIWFRAGLTAVGHFIRRIGLPLIDAGLILLSFWLMKIFWTSYVRTETEYESRLLWLAFPAFSVFYLVAAYYAGLYDRWYKRMELVRSTLIATVLLLAGYALLPEQYRFSRGIVLFGAVLAFVLISVLRWMLISTRVLNSSREREEQATAAIAGTVEEYNEALQLLKEAGMHRKVLGRIATDANDANALGYWKQIGSIGHAIPFREIIFCQGQLGFKDIIDAVQILPAGIVARIHATGSGSIVGSDSKDTSGESVSTENGFNLSKPYNRRLKRLMDVVIALLGLVSFPIQVFIIRNPFRFGANCLQVLFAKKTWIGYALPEKKLPVLPEGVLACNGIPVRDRQPFPPESLQMMDYWYARDYEPGNDLKLIGRMYRKLGG